MTFFWKYPGILRRSGVGPWLILGMAFVGACFSGSPVLDWVVSSARADNVSYAYNASGRVIQATDNSSGQAVFYCCRHQSDWIGAVQRQHGRSIRAGGS
jgi:hypothetical protein